MSNGLNDVQVPIIRPLWLNITQEPVIELAQSLHRNLIFAGLANGAVRLINQKTGETHQDLACHEMGLLSIAYQSERNLLATSGEDSMLKIWDLQSEKPLYQQKFKGWVEKLVWSGSTLYFSQGKNLWKWDFSHGSAELIETWSHSISDLDLKNESELAVCGYSRLCLYDLESLKAQENFEWKGQLFKLQFSPNGRYAVCASNDLSIHIWDLKKQKDLSMRGFPGKIRDLHFRSDGLYMANCSGPEVVVWDYMDPGPAHKRPQVLGPFEKDVQFVRYQNQGKMLCTFGEDGVVIFWRPDLFDDKPLAIAGIRDQAIRSSLWTQDDRAVVTGLQTGYVALYPAPEVQD